jgi:hypothetical protein
MPPRLLALNALFAALALVAVVYIVRELRAPAPTAAGSGRANAPAAGPNVRPPAPPSAPGAYDVVVGRNLFSPSRSEAPTTAVAAGPAAVAARPALLGVVLRDGAPLAYLEDPTTKRVSGYRLGDSIGGGSVQAIGADHVVIARPEGTVDVQLRDPSRPRAAAPAAAPGQPDTPAGQAVTPPAGGPPTGAPPGVIPPAVQNPNPMPPAPNVQPLPPGAQLPGGRRGLSPNLLRRFPQGADATQ